MNELLLLLYIYINRINFLSFSMSIFNLKRLLITYQKTYNNFPSNFLFKCIYYMISHTFVYYGVSYYTKY